VLRQDVYKSTKVQAQIDTQTSITMGVTDVSIPEGDQEGFKITESTMHASGKRKADDEPGPPGKKSKQGTPNVCRDVLDSIRSSGSPLPSKR